MAGKQVEPNEKEQAYLEECRTIATSVSESIKNILESNGCRIRVISIIDDGKVTAQIQVVHNNSNIGS